MEQYTLLYVLDSTTKVVHMKTFLTYAALKDFKYFELDGALNKYPIQQIDKDGYVWFVERRED